VLEVGIGAGTLAVSLAREGIRTIGVDLSPAMLELSLQAARTQGVAGKVSVALADASRLPFRDDEFSLVIAIGVVPWVADPRAVVVELARVTASSGHLVITADNSRRLTHALDPRLNPWLARPRRRLGALVPGGPRRSATARGLSRGGFGRMLGESGLEVLRSEPLGFGPFTLLGREIVPDRLGYFLNALLQKGARRGLIGLPETACQHLVLARSDVSRGRGGGPAHGCPGPSPVGEVSGAAC
jgi:ubiquinone/menaquinone biosynthesis C-methylase UbiE